MSQDLDDLKIIEKKASNIAVAQMVWIVRNFARQYPELGPLQNWSAEDIVTAVENNSPYIGTQCGLSDKDYVALVQESEEVREGVR